MRHVTRDLLVLGLTCALLFLLWSGAGLTGSTHADSPTTGKTYQFVNGRWFDGRKFRHRTFYSVDGLLTGRRPRAVDEVIDLKGGYVVPPFGDAHNHYLAGLYNAEKVIRQYLQDGIFYVENPTNIARDTNQTKGLLNKPESVDAIFANGGITAAGGHPLEFYVKGGSLSRVKKPGPDGSFENLAYFIVDNERDLSMKWPLILADRPDLIKTQLLYSEEFEKRRDDPSYLGYKGLDPKLLPLIVARAHASHLRVACHIETAADFRNAVAAGVDQIAHMPGYYPDFVRAQPGWYPITARDAARAARKGVAVVTTTYVSTAELKKPEELKQAREVQAHNLRLLHEAGVKLAIGPDVYGVTSLAEAMNLYDLKVFDNLTLLKMWCETTPEVIFPSRKIGRLREGYEASFIVLGGDPVAHFESVRDIRQRFKQGLVIGAQPAG